MWRYVKVRDKCGACYQPDMPPGARSFCARCESDIAHGRCPRNQPRTNIYCGIPVCPVHGSKGKEKQQRVAEKKQAAMIKEHLTIQQHELDILERMWRIS